MLSEEVAFSVCKFDDDKLKHVTGNLLSFHGTNNGKKGFGTLGILEKHCQVHVS